jgi:hypothetical protein
MCKNQKLKVESHVCPTCQEYDETLHHIFSRNEATTSEYSMQVLVVLARIQTSPQVMKA